MAQESPPEGIPSLDDEPEPGVTSELLLEEDPIREHLARQLASNDAFAATAVAIYWPLLLLWLLARAIVRRLRRRFSACEPRGEDG